MARQYERRTNEKNAQGQRGGYGRDRKGRGGEGSGFKRADRPESKKQRTREDEESIAARQEALEEAQDYIIMGRNAVREAIRSGRSIDRILTVKETDGSLREIISMARDRGIEVRETDRSKLDELCMPFGHGEKTGNHQGIVARTPGVEYCEIEDMISYAREKGEAPFIIILDGIEDPHNMGSIIRSAECAGAHGVIIPKRRSAPVTAATAKASAGAVEYMRIARVPNIVQAMEKLKELGLWIAGADMEGVDMHSAALSGAIGLVIGSEGEGLSRLVKQRCDFTVSIPMFGEIASLNAAVAAAILMYEKRRQG